MGNSSVLEQTTTQDPIAVSRKFFATFNAVAVEECVAALSIDVSYESDSLPTPVLKGRAAARSAVEAYTKAFPDLHVEIEQEIASGTSVVVRWKSTGTHTGDFGGISATGRKVTTHGCTVQEIRDGQIVRSVNYWDNLSMMQQLGVLP